IVYADWKLKTKDLESKIVHFTLNHDEPEFLTENDGEGGESHHNWFNEIVRSKNSAVVVDEPSSAAHIRGPPVKKELSLLTREVVIEQPRVWAQICVRRMLDQVNSYVLRMGEIIDKSIQELQNQLAARQSVGGEFNSCGKPRA
ncbi:unnamed protein product, partial [Linum tenue]